MVEEVVLLVVKEGVVLIPHQIDLQQTLALASGLAGRLVFVAGSNELLVTESDHHFVCAVLASASSYHLPASPQQAEVFFPWVFWLSFELT